MNDREREMLNDVEYEDLKAAMIERELKERVNAIKLLGTSFDVDDVSFTSSKYPCTLGVLTTPDGFDRLAHIVDKEVYETTINEREAIAFEYEGIEVYRYGNL